MTDPERPPADNWIQRRRDKIYEEIQRNRRGEYLVPTWVLTAILLLIVGGFVALLIFTP
ncbi:hypothetical protein [Allorhizocola rhizosphaerae]|uniref:hypothetical protein n=1 Tax=Allorhizocola rhizosphaerae TaxID=1872709 RepID=UPI001FE72E41|nr:hypothetical protein [Allorhizocola rhizosphaerae]